MAVTNSTILGHVWLEGTNDFQQRIPNPTQAGLAATIEKIAAPMNGDLWNQFSANLNNTIGYTLIDALRWDNPFDIFRRESLRWGNSIREILPKWLKSHTFSDTSKNLLDIDKADFAQWYYSVNYETKYPWDLNRAELLRAMSAPDGSTAINDLYSAVATQALNSDSYDIAMTCIDCIAKADEWEGGIYRQHVEQSTPATGADRTENAKSLLEAVRSMVYRLPWPSQLYNHVPVPVFARPEELVLFVTPETRAMVDVRAYAELFNVSYAEMQMRIMVIPEMPVADALAILTTRDFIHWHDTVYGIFSFFNIDTLNDKQILHHQAIVSPNPSVPIIAFTTEETTTTTTITMSATSLTLTPDKTEIEAGETVALNPKINGTVTDNDDGIEVLPDSATYSVTSDTDALNTRTYVDKFGELHTQKSLTGGSKLTVQAVSTYRNPDGSESNLSTSAEITISA